MNVGQVIDTNHGQVYVMDRPNSRFVQIMFLEPPYSVRTVQIANLKTGSVANRPDRPKAVKRKGRSKRYAAFQEDGTTSPEYSIWARIKRRCRSGSVMCTEWRDFQVFAKWYHAQPRPETNEFRWIFTHQLLDPDNRFYAPETCHVAPEPLVRTLIRSSNPNVIRQSIEHHRKWIPAELYQRLIENNR